MAPLVLPTFKAWTEQRAGTSRPSSSSTGDGAGGFEDVDVGASSPIGADAGGAGAASEGGAEGFTAAVLELAATMVQTLQSNGRLSTLAIAAWQCTYARPLRNCSLYLIRRADC